MIYNVVLGEFPVSPEVRTPHFHYNVVLVSGIQHSDSVIYINIKLFRFFSLIGYYKILSIVPCAIQ